MSKKIIAILTVATILFVCIFAACEKKAKPYMDADDIDAITNENGEFELAEDGQYIVYVTDEDGKKVTDKNGEFETEVQQFVPTIKKGVIEDYGFKLKIPKGWKVTEEGNVFSRGSDETVEVSLIKKTYDEYYDTVSKVIVALDEGGIKCSIKEDASLVEGADRGFMNILYLEDVANVGYAFENHGNLYNIAYKAPSDKADMEAINAFLENWEFKPFTYYPELTDVSEEGESSTVEGTTAEATTK